MLNDKFVRGTMAAAIMFAALAFASPAAAQTCGDGFNVDNGGDSNQCDPEAITCPGFENGLGGCNLYEKRTASDTPGGDPYTGVACTVDADCPGTGETCKLDEGLCIKPTCNSGSSCFFAFSCCKFNCNNVGSGVECNDDNVCTAGETCDQDGACGAPGNIDTTLTNALTGTSCGDQTTTQCDLPNTCSGAVGVQGGETAFCQDNYEPVGTSATTLCDDSEFCTDDECDGSGGCQNIALADGTVCIASQGICDPQEVCQTGVCPADAKAPTTTECNASQGICDPSEYCDGVNDTCPTDAKQPTSVVCRTSDGDVNGVGFLCDPAEYCDGVGNDCPTDFVHPGGTTCNAGSGDPNASGVTCDPTEVCSGVPGASCAPDTIVAGGTPCRASAGTCDPQETCSGVADQACGPDLKEPTSVVCRAGNDCDAAENCDGVGNECPPDILSASTVVCRPGDGDPNGSGFFCDPPEYCTGSSPTCPSDVVQPAGTTCNPGSGDPHASGFTCDPDETCSGTPGVPCSGDTFSASSQTCNPSGGDCDLQESCPGVADQPCPADAKRPSTHVCRNGDGDPNGSGFFCDPEEVCDGVSDTCPNDVVQPAGTTCNPGSGDPHASGFTCDPDETCSGTPGDPCSSDTFSAANVVCNAGSGDPHNSGVVCDPDELCPGIADQPCAADTLEPAGTVCRQGSGTPFGGLECDQTESCSGTPDVPCDVDVIVAAGSRCRDQLGECDLAEECSGTNADPCPQDLFVADDTACYTEPPINHEPHEPLPGETLPCKPGECVCESGYCVGPGTLSLSKIRVKTDRSVSKPVGAASAVGVVFDQSTLPTEFGGDLLQELEAGHISISISDGGGFNSTDRLSECARKGDVVSCKGERVKAKFKKMRNTEATWNFSVRVKRLSTIDTGYPPLNTQLTLTLHQPDRFYRVDRRGELSANCLLRGGSSVLVCRPS